MIGRCFDIFRFCQRPHGQFSVEKESLLIIIIIIIINRFLSSKSNNKIQVGIISLLK
jgi:hypothetical protein